MWRHRNILAIAILTAGIVGLAAMSASSAAADVGVGARQVSIDFSSAGAGEFPPDLYHSDGIVFSSENAYPGVSMVQGDDALVMDSALNPAQLRATFTRPVSAVAASFAPALQGTATWVLSAFAANGELLARTSVTVTEDFGDPENEGWGYRTIALTGLSAPAKVVTLTNVFVRSSFPLNTWMPFGVNWISFTHWEPPSVQ